MLATRRVYVPHAGRIEKRTTDHTLAQELLDRDGEGARATMPPEFPHTPTRCISQSRPCRLTKAASSWRRDRVLFCTDGLNKVVPPAKLPPFSNPPMIPNNSAALIEAANASEGLTISLPSSFSSTPEPKKSEIYRPKVESKPDNMLFRFSWDKRSTKREPAATPSRTCACAASRGTDAATYSTG